jgi:hypothetical protein
MREGAGISSTAYLIESWQAKDAAHGRAAARVVGPPDDCAMVSIEKNGWQNETATLKKQPSQDAAANGLPMEIRNKIATLTPRRDSDVFQDALIAMVA